MEHKRGLMSNTKWVKLLNALASTELDVHPMSGHLKELHSDEIFRFYLLTRAVEYEGYTSDGLGVQ